MRIRNQIVYVAFNALFGLLAVALWETLSIPGILLWVLALSAANILCATHMAKKQSVYVHCLEQANQKMVRALQDIHAQLENIEP